MVIGIKTHNFSLSRDKQEGTFDKGDGLGWAPGYEAKSEGLGINTIRYGKNFSRMKGTCKKCDCFTGKNGTNGEHCSLPLSEGCKF